MLWSALGHGLACLADLLEYSWRRRQMLADELYISAFPMCYMGTMRTALMCQVMLFQEVKCFHVRKRKTTRRTCIKCIRDTLGVPYQNDFHQSGSKPLHDNLQLLGKPTARLFCCVTEGARGALQRQAPVVLTPLSAKRVTTGVTGAICQRDMGVLRQECGAAPKRGSCRAGGEPAAHRRTHASACAS